MASVNEVQDEGRKQSLQEGEGPPPNPSNCDILGHVGHYVGVTEEGIRDEVGETPRWFEMLTGRACRTCVCAVVCRVHDIKE